MKKIMMIGLFLCFNSTVMAAEVCADGVGIVFTAKNGHKYCYSDVAMNWWSANAWCDTAGGQLVDVNTDCACSGDTCEKDVKCPNFKDMGKTVSGRDPWVWTRTMDTPWSKGGSAYVIHLSSNLMAGYSFNSKVKALCRMN